MHDAYEVRDAQYLMGRLADDGVVDPQRIGAAGGSYGGGMAIALGALRNRTMLPDGSLVPWTSPGGTPMQIAATTLDYVAGSPYRGPLGDRRVGVQKQARNGSLFLAGQFLGNYAPAGSDPRADIVGWKAITDSGGPFDGNAAAQAMTDELAAHHSAYYIDDSVAFARRCSPTAGTTTSSRSTRRSATTTRSAPTTRRRRSRCSRSTSATTRAPAPSPRRTRRRWARPRTPGWTTTSRASGPSPAAATYEVPAATVPYTLAGFPTVVGTLHVTGANDAVYERLYDVDGATEQLIARGVLRPDLGTARQVFQLHPQAWTVRAGPLPEARAAGPGPAVPAHRLGSDAAAADPGERPTRPARRPTS